MSPVYALMLLGSGDLVREYRTREEAEDGLRQLIELEPELAEDAAVWQFANGKPVGEPITLGVYA